jgi:hypothetical protein
MRSCLLTREPRCRPLPAALSETQLVQPCPPPWRTGQGCASAPGGATETVRDRDRQIRRLFEKVRSPRPSSWLAEAGRCALPRPRRLAWLCRQDNSCFVGCERSQVWILAARGVRGRCLLVINARLSLPRTDEHRRCCSVAAASRRAQAPAAFWQRPVASPPLSTRSAPPPLRGKAGVLRSRASALMATGDLALVLRRPGALAGTDGHC